MEVECLFAENNTNIIQKGRKLKIYIVEKNGM